MNPTLFTVAIAAVAVASAWSCLAAPVVLEAEAAESIEAPAVRVDFATPPTGVAPVSGASGDSYLSVPQGAGNPPAVTTGKAVYKVTVPEAGDYTLWIRTYWDDCCGNSVGVQINDTEPFMVEDSTYKTWHWVKSPPRLGQLRLPAGPLTLTLSNREDGVRVDQILLTTQRRFVPTEIEVATVAAAPAAK